MIRTTLSIRSLSRLQQFPEPVAVGNSRATHWATPSLTIQSHLRTESGWASLFSKPIHLHLLYTEGGKTLIHLRDLRGPRSASKPGILITSLSVGFRLGERSQTEYLAGALNQLIRTWTRVSRLREWGMPS